MAAETEFINFKANMSDLHKQLAQLPGITDKEAKGMVRSLERQLKRTEKAAAKAAKKSRSSFDEMGRAANRTGRDLKKMGAAAGELSPALGGAFNMLGSFGKLVTALTNPVNLAIAGIVGLGAAGVGTAVGMVKVTQASEELLETTKPLAGIDGLLPELDQGAIDSIHRANDAMNALGHVVDGFTLTLGAEFAPYVERGADLLLRLALMGQDAFQEFAAGHDILREFATFLVQEFVQTLTYPIDGLMDLIGLMGDLAGAVGLDTVSEKLSGVQNSWEGFTHSIASGIVDTAFGAAAEGVAWLDEKTQAYAGTAEQLISITGRQRRAMEEVRDVNAELAELLAGMRAEQLTAEQKILAAYDAQIAKIAELEAAGANAHEAQMARNIAGAMAAQEILDLQYEAAQATVESTSEALDQVAADMGGVFSDLERMIEQSRQTILGSIGSIAGTISDVTGQMAETVAERGGKGAMALYRISQAAGISQATIAAYTAYAQALALPLPPPAPQLAAGAALASGLAAVGQIAMTPAPMAHMGQIAPSTGLQPDEIFTGGGTRALKPETVLDTATTQRLGGEQGINELMSGRGGPGLVAVASPWKHLDSELDELLLRDSRTARRLTGSGRVGVRSR